MHLSTDVRQPKVHHFYQRNCRYLTRFEVMRTVHRGQHARQGEEDHKE
jgi:hypothetical protein